MDDLIAKIQSLAPALTVQQARPVEHGQFSQVVIVNEAWVFRFPRTLAAAREMSDEITVLDRLQGHLPLRIPQPPYTGYDPATGLLRGMGYAMLPGQPLWIDELQALDAPVRHQIAAQLAGFLKTLHSLPLPLPRPPGETHAFWAQMLHDFQQELYPHMRPQARAEVTAHFEHFLNDPTNFAITPRLRHGDFGSSNILYDPATATITGIIDFSFTGYGDPAQDTAALSTYGETLLHDCFPVYPALREMMGRVDFIRSTYALQQALYAQRAGDDDDFEDGIADYQ